MTQACSPTSTRWVGVSIALLGSLIVAPSAVGLLWRSGRDWLRRQLFRLRDRLSRFLPFLRRETTIQVHNSDHAHGSESASVMVVRRGWPPGLSVEEQVDALRRRLAELQDQLDRLSRDVKEEAAARERTVSDLHQRVKVETATSEGTSRRGSRRASGLTLVASPWSAWASFSVGRQRNWRRSPSGLGWLFPALGLSAAAVAAGHAWRERVRRKA